MLRSRLLTQALLVGLVLGLAAAAVMMAVAWQHNPQGEFHAPDIINWDQWLAVGLAWLLVGTAVGTTLAGALLALVRPAHRQRSDANAG